MWRTVICRGSGFVQHSAQMRARATGVVLARKVISRARRFSLHDSCSDWSTY